MPDDVTAKDREAAHSILGRSWITHRNDLGRGDLRMQCALDIAIALAHARAEGRREGWEAFGRQIASAVEQHEFHKSGECAHHIQQWVQSRIARGPTKARSDDATD